MPKSHKKRKLVDNMKELRDMGNGLVKYNDELYMVTRIKDDKANLAHPNGGKVIHKDVPIHDLYVAGGKKERKLKGYRLII